MAAADSSPRVSVLVLNKDQRDALACCLESVERQTYIDRETIVIDNASTDGSVELVRSRFTAIQLLALTRNVGYSGGHNRGLAIARGAYALLLNADIVLEPTFLEEAVRVMEQAADIGMVQGKLYQMRDRSMVPGDRRIDSVGLAIYRDRRIGLRGYGEVDRRQYERAEEIFAPDGAAPLYRRAMLDDIRLNREYLDETFFMYREEVDLGWRARWRGWRAVYTPRAMAFHVRRYAPGQRQLQPRWLRRLQHRNRYWLLIKNDSWRALRRDLLPILWFELRAAGYTMFVEPHYVAAYLSSLAGLSRMWRQRQALIRRRRVKPGELARWFVG